MIKYFSIHYSLDEKIMGKIPQVKETISNCHINNPNFIDNFSFKKIEDTPLLSTAVLYAKAKQTDLIETGAMGFSLGSLLISDRLKKVFEQFNCLGIQFFPTYIIHKNEKIDSYWQSHIYDFPYDFIDFKNTDLLLEDRDENDKRIKYYLERVTDKDAFLKLAENMKYPKRLSLKNISFVEEMNLDYFFLRYFEGATRGIVSERLKKEIGKQKITGIEFKPIEVSLNDWYGPDGLREKFYSRVPHMRPDGSIRK